MICARRVVLIIPTLLCVRFTQSMPTSARKSSLGAARRAQQRAHLPFRADDLGLGKRTGLPVPTIEHKSDDFEPFDEILSHADTRAAWHGQSKRPGSSKKRKSVATLYEEDDGGEMSMELDDYGESQLAFMSRYQRSSLSLGHRKVDLSVRVQTHTSPIRASPHRLWLIVLGHLRVASRAPRTSTLTRCHRPARGNQLSLACAVHR